MVMRKSHAEISVAIWLISLAILETRTICIAPMRSVPVRGRTFDCGHGFGATKWLNKAIPGRGEARVWLGAEL
jgi:hypothetical protein